MSARDSAPTDPFDLARFVAAQQGAYEAALMEVRSGAKRSHWMWFVFPQIEGLGHSPMARRYAIRNLEEAKAYLAHPVLGARLLEIAHAAVDLPETSASAIFGSPDDLKLHSCATLFGQVSAPGSVFDRLLEKFFAGEPDLATLRIISALPRR